MTTFIVLFSVASVLLLVPAFMLYRHTRNTHEVDLMAGDEGER